MVVTVKMLKIVTFSNAEVCEFYNKNFICMEVAGEKLSLRFKIFGFPALFFIDEIDKVILRNDGYKSPSALIEHGKKVLAG